MKFEKVQQLLKDKNVDALVILSPHNRRYLSMFTGSSGSLLITKNQNYLITDFRYIEQATKQAKGFEIINERNISIALKQLCEKHQIKSLGFEGDLITFHQYTALKDIAELVDVAGEIEKIRMIKEPFEIELIQKAADIADETYAFIQTIVKPGVSEMHINHLMEMKMRELGATGSSFDTIVASGVRGALPHGVASDKIIESGDMITFDYGAIYNGYVSDITRTLAVGNPKDEMIKIYNIVLESQMTALNTIKKGMTGGQADKISRDVIASYGYGEAFGHSLGHGIGLEVHEGPMLHSKSETILEENMCITLEPGIYIEGLGGVRIEDDCLVTENGLKRFTQSTKDLIIL
ncbi:Xaa-Pro peptidase family protein [Macrococcus sp. DPC7161]|uniref:M24 family metallopeptidase n=1 Tax=Macrococcus sp. DPC7161 TaxID=2507060 RepID=UPI00100AB7BE|nr:aminopeptidase P family protein [Macrococcus sp. DPC7161]RXK19342.1 aminopeptidase P family protein [Macrococcus sp. DPC7161]